VASGPGQGRTGRVRPPDRKLSQLGHPDGTAGPTGTAGFRAEAGRCHLYVALICRWASRTRIACKLKGPDRAVSVSVVEPALTDQGGRFGDDPGGGLSQAERCPLP